MLKHSIKIFFLFLLFAQFETFAGKSFYVLTVNFATSSIKAPAAKPCTRDTLFFNLVHAGSNQPFTDQEAVNLSWTLDAYTQNLIYTTTSAIGKSAVFIGIPEPDAKIIYVKIDSTNLFSVNTDQTIQFTQSPNVDLGGNISSCPGVGAFIKNNLTTDGAYLWNTGATTSSINVTTAGIYSAEVTIIHPENVCISKDIVNFKYFPKPEIEAGGTRFRCFKEQLQLNAVFTTQGTPPYTWLWTSANLTGSNTQNPVVDSEEDLVPNSRDYTVIVTDKNGCKDESIVTVKKNPQFKISINKKDTTLCKFVSLPLSIIINATALGTGATASDYKYKWSTSEGLSNANISNPSVQAVSIAGISYIVTVTDLNLCSAKDTITIKKSTLEMSFASTVQDIISVCSGDVVSGLKINRRGGKAPYNFIWQPIGNLVKTSDSLYTTKPITENQKVIAMVSDATGCTDKDSVSFVLKALPVSRIVNRTDNICVGSPKQFFALLDTDSFTDYIVKWSPNLRISNVNDYKPIFTGDNAESSTSQNYAYTITSKINLCSYRDTLKLITRAFTPVSIENLFDGKPFINKSNGFKANPDGLTYLWNLASVTGTPILTPSLNNQQTFAYEFNTIGIYNLSLSGTNQYGCTSLIIRELDVKNPSVNILYVPTVFSPGAQFDANKTLKVFFTEGSVDPTSFKISVFSPQGQKVFESSDILKMRTEGWSGDDFPAGAYTWVVQCKFTDDTEYKQAKSVTLVR